MDSKLIYKTLCESRKSLKESYGYGSGLHAHHIIPKHSGGSEEPENFTYLTPREHTIAHYLLWRIYRNPNDLRSMNMLGANLSVSQRRVIGEFCRDNGIGIFSEEYRIDKELNSKRGRKAAKTQMEKGSAIFDPERRREYFSMGGKVGGKVQYQNGQGIHNPEHRAKYASLGGKSHKGKRCMFKPGDTTFKRVKPEDIESFIEQGYVFGSPYKFHNKK